MRALFLGFVCLTVELGQANAENYANGDYGFSVNVPNNLARCSSGSADHGIGVYLDGRLAAMDDGCAAKPTGRVVTVYAEYSDEPTLRAASSIDCKPDNQSVRISPPSDLKLGNRLSYVCRLDRRKKWIDVLVSAECAIPPSLSSICRAWLHTTPASFDIDLQVFRQIIKSVRFTKVVDNVPGKPNPE